MGDIWTLLTARRRTSPGAPLVTFIDTPLGERTELSSTSVENAAAKIANALRDEYDLEPGSTVGLALPLHWQRTAWCAGAWTAGCAIAIGPRAAAADLIVAGPAEAASLAHLAPGRVVVASLHPFGLPGTDPLPPRTADVTLAVRAQPDAYLYETPDGALPALFAAGAETLTQEGLLALARQRADEWTLRPGGRLLVDDRADPLDSWLGALVVPLAAQASVVMVRGAYDSTVVSLQERTTAVTGPQR